MAPKTGPELALKDLVLGNVRDMYEDLTAIAKDADFLIAHEIVYAAPSVAEVLKLSWASCTLAPSSFFSAYEPITTSVYPALAKLHHFGPGINRWVVKFAHSSLVVPYSLDQPDNAARIQQLGTSRTITRKQYLASRVTEELSQLLKVPSYATKAAEIRRIMQSEHGVCVACNAIEKHLKEIGRL